MSTETNTEIATRFMTLAARGEVQEAYDRYVAGDFRHHNAYFPGDRQSLLLAMQQSAQAEPNKACTIRQVVAEGDRVVLLSHLVRGDGSEYAVVHIYRFEGGKIVELWDLAQAIPADSPNALGMF